MRGIAPIGPAQAGIFSGRYLVANTGTEAALVDLDSSHTSYVPLDFKTHGFVQNPQHPERVWAIGITWPGTPEKDKTIKSKAFALEMDVRNGSVLQKLNLPVDEGFGGHGFFTADGSVLFLPRLNIRTGMNFLTGYDAANCNKVVANYPLAPGVPHDAQLLKNGNAMIACPGIVGGDYTSRIKKDELIEINIGSGKIIRKWAFDDKKEMINHFALLQNGNLFAFSEGGLGDVPGRAYSGRYETDAMREIPFNDTIKPGRPGEFLSVAINESQNRAFVTDVPGGRSLLIDTEQCIFIKQVDNSCKGMVFDKKSGFFIGANATISLFDKDGKYIAGKDAERLEKLGAFGGPHSLLAEIT